jgi:signal peptidase I
MTSTPVFRLARFLFARAIVVTNCALILAIIAFFVAQPVTGKSYSMFPNMGEGDVLVINKRAYGYSHLSCPVFLIWDTRSLCEKFDADPESRNFSAQPERGDVISIQQRPPLEPPGFSPRRKAARFFPVLVCRK